jgi:seryl-tRNA synthetase
MHDIRAIRADPAAFDVAMARRGVSPIAAVLLEQDARRRAILSKMQTAQAAANVASKLIGTAIRAGRTEEAAQLRAQSTQAFDDAQKHELNELEMAIKATLETLPNVLDSSVPDGPDETANVVLKLVGKPRDFNFTPRQHFELGEELGMMDFATASKLAGARFTVLRGPLARMERALGQFMLDHHTIERGYLETIVPSLVNAAAVYGTGSLPKFEEDLFKTTDDPPRYLIPTAEVPLTNTVAGDIVPEKLLPLRLTALTDCFRSEAGAAGRDTRGMLRQHQFRKVELVCIAHPDQSGDEHEWMTRSGELILEKLGLPYRRMLLASGDTGFASTRTHDLEVWLPGQGMYREISSCSNCKDFQARRMNARFRGRADGKAVAFVHTLNGSGVAVGRALIAVMENYQQADGSIVVPQVLRQYMGGLDSITAL